MYYAFPFEKIKPIQFGCDLFRIMIKQLISFKIYPNKNIKGLYKNIIISTNTVTYLPNFIIIFYI